MTLPWTWRHPWLALSTAGTGLLGVAWLDPTLLASGGLAAPVGTVLVGLGLGWPIARAERSTVLPDGPLGTAAGATADVMAVLLAATVAALIVQFLGPIGLASVIVAWAAAGFAGRVSAIGVALLLLIALFVGSVGAGMALPVEPWTLLHPGFDRALSWAPSAGLAGLILAGVGLGAPSPVRLPPRAPLAAVGLGGLLLFILALRLAVPFETATSAEDLAVVDPIALMVLGFVAAAGIVGTGLRPRVGPGLAATGLLVTALLAGPAVDGFGLWITGLLPAGLAVSLGLRAATTGGRPRWVLVGGAVLLAAVPAVAWPGLPGPVAAATLALLPVLLVWVAGTRALSARSA